MNFDNFTLLEAVVKRAPLGLRFFDLAYSMNVTDGLNVTARPYAKPLPILRAAHSPVSGIYGFYSLPGLRQYEDNENPASDWCDGIKPPNWVISVEDTFGRFLPQVMPMCLPKENLLGVPMYSNPARTATAGYAAVRGELWDKTNDKPASWALVSAKNVFDIKYKYSSVADGRGMFVLFLPYPKPISGTTLNEQAWLLDFQVLYEPKAHLWLIQTEPETNTGETVEAAKQRIPPDSNVLLEQAAAGVFDIAAGANPTLTSALRYRTDLVLKTRDKEPDSPTYEEKYKIAEHRLWIAPA